MATTEKTTADKPWHVRTDGGGFVKGFDNEGMADKHADVLNTQAEGMGLSTRYVVSAKP